MRVKEKIKDAKAKDFRLQYFRKGTLITSGQDALRKLIFVKNGSCQVIRKMTTLCDKRLIINFMPSLIIVKLYKIKQSPNVNDKNSISAWEATRWRGYLWSWNALSLTKWSIILSVSELNALKNLSLILRTKNDLIGQSGKRPIRSKKYFWLINLIRTKFKILNLLIIKWSRHCRSKHTRHFKRCRSNNHLGTFLSW